MSYLHLSVYYLYVKLHAHIDTSNSIITTKCSSRFISGSCPPFLDSGVPMVINGFYYLIRSLFFNHFSIASATSLVYSRNRNKSRLARARKALEEVAENEISIASLISKF